MANRQDLKAQLNPYDPPTSRTAVALSIGAALLGIGIMICTILYGAGTIS